MALPLQTIESDQVMAFREADLSENDPRERGDKVEEFFRKEALCCIDLKHDPAARFCLFRMSESERILMTGLPSVCADSRSLKNLFREIARAYAARLRGEELPGQPVQYVDFVEWQKEMLEQEGQKDEKRHS